MSAGSERPNGGLFALTVDEAERLMLWAGYADMFEQEDDTDPDYLLFDRLREWRRRHEVTE